MTETARIPLITGIVLAILVGGLLATSPAAFVGKGATFIDTEAWADRGGGVPVQTTGYLRSPEGLASFPEGFGEWNMSADVSDEPGWQSVKSTFKADTVVSRYYAKPGIYQPLHVFMIDSQYTRVLHSLPVSYGLQGYEAQQSERTWLNVTNASWLSDESANQQIPVVEGTFVQKNATTGEVTERRLVHYYWVKREAWGVTNHLTWVGTNMRVPAEGNISAHREVMANFTTEITSQLFTPEPTDVESTVAEALLGQGIFGQLLLGGSIGVPLALIGYGLWGGPGRPGAPAAAGGPAEMATQGSREPDASRTDGGGSDPGGSGPEDVDEPPRQPEADSWPPDQGGDRGSRSG